MTPIRACMGGWCHHRTKCMHYEAPTCLSVPSERLCEPGGEREMFFIPIKPETETSAEPA